MTILEAEARLTAMRVTYDGINALVRAVPKTDMARAFALEDKAARLDAAIMRGPEREIATAVPTTLNELAVQLRLLVTYTSDDRDDEGEGMLIQTLARNSLAYVESLIAGGRTQS